MVEKVTLGKGTGDDGDDVRTQTGVPTPTGRTHPDDQAVGPVGDSAVGDEVDDVDMGAVVASWNRIAAWILTLGGAVGFFASFVLTVERIELAEDPTFSPSCNFNSVFSCGSVMVTPQAALFGFPNPLLGVAGFAVAVASGMALFAGARFAGWYWAGLQVGVTAALVFIHWLIFQSLYSIHALCPYCMVVWAMTIPMFVFVTIRNLHASGLTTRSRPAAIIAQSHGLIITVWVLVIIALIGVEFWDFWSSLYS